MLESVSPTIVTAGGGEEVTITGSTSIEEGAEVYIDGRKVTGVTRSIDINGNKVLLKFKAPAGRLGKTQLAVVNPQGASPCGISSTCSPSIKTPDHHRCPGQRHRGHPGGHRR